MLLSRHQLLNKFIGAFTLLSTKNSNDAVNCNPTTTEEILLLDNNNNPIQFEAKFHPNPNGVVYEKNPTVFARILEGSLPSYTYFENDNFITIRDRTTKAKFHALVLPKQYIHSIQTLEHEDLSLVQEMKEIALSTLEKFQPEAYKNGDYILCFHVPPFISVGHLHLHVLAPASEMKFFYKCGKYLIGSPWCTGVDNVIETLEEKRQLF